MIWQAHLFSDHFMLQNKGLTKLENYGHIKNHCDSARPIRVTETRITTPFGQFYFRGTLVVT